MGKYVPLNLYGHRRNIMATVLGIGGIFFKCKDPEALSAWYAKHLGIRASEHGAILFPINQLPDNAYTVWSPFPSETDYFDPAKREFMMNLVVDDVRGAIDQVVAGGAQQIGDIEQHEYGRFGWFLDPEGNKVELWEPKSA